MQNSMNYLCMLLFVCRLAVFVCVFVVVCMLCTVQGDGCHSAGRVSGL